MLRKQICLAAPMRLSRITDCPSIATITFESPETRNAMTADLGKEFRETVLTTIKDDAAKGDIRALIVTGSGTAFSAGGDVGFLNTRLKDTPEGNIKAMMEFYFYFLSVRQLKCPVIAAINGPAIGAGLSFALGCDYRVAAADAKLAVNFVKLGIHPGMGSSFTLPRLVGHSRATQMLLTGQQITGQQAFDFGIVNDVVPSPPKTGDKKADIAMQNELVLKKAVDIATVFARDSSYLAVSQAVETLRGDPEELKRACMREAKAQAECYTDGRDLKEALNALKEKRSPKYV